MKNKKCIDILKLSASQILSDNNYNTLEDKLKGSINWNYLSSKIINHKFSALFYKHCKSRNILHLLPEWLKLLLANEYKDSFFHNITIQNFLKDFSNTLSQNSLKVIVLKGAALLGDVYKDVAIRSMEDIDLLVKPKDLYKLKEVLRENGFKQDIAYSNSYKKGVISLDLHTNVFSSDRIKSREFLTTIKSEDIWNTSKAFGTSGSLFKLSLYHNIISSALHIQKHGYSRFFWFVDISESIISAGEKFNWQSFSNYVISVKAERVVLYVLLLIKDITGLTIPDKVLEKIGLNRLSHIEKQILKLRMEDRPTGKLTHLLYLFQLNSFSLRLRFLLESVFPRKEIISEMSIAHGKSSKSVFAFPRRLFNVIRYGLGDALLLVKIIFTR